MQDRRAAAMTHEGAMGRIRASTRLGWRMRLALVDYLDGMPVRECAC